jgi:hypothetical protein
MGTKPRYPAVYFELSCLHSIAYLPLWVHFENGSGRLHKNYWNKVYTVFYENLLEKKDAEAMVITSAHKTTLNITPP